MLSNLMWPLTIKYRNGVLLLTVLVTMLMPNLFICFCLAVNLQTFVSLPVVEGEGSMVPRPHATHLMDSKSFIYSGSDLTAYTVFHLFFCWSSCGLKHIIYIIHPCNLWVRGSNLTGGHNRLSCPRSADTALKPYLTLPYLKHISLECRQNACILS